MFTEQSLHRLVFQRNFPEIDQEKLLNPITQAICEERLLNLANPCHFVVRNDQKWLRIELDEPQHLQKGISYKFFHTNDQLSCHSSLLELENINVRYWLIQFMFSLFNQNVRGWYLLFLDGQVV